MGRVRTPSGAVEHVFSWVEFSLGWHVGEVGLDWKGVWLGRPQGAGLAAGETEGQRTPEESVAKMGESPAVPLRRAAHRHSRPPL